MTGRKIYENFTNGTGPDGLSGGAAIVNEVAAVYSERAEAIRRITEKMEAAWQGEAAGAARRGIGPLGVEHELAGVDLATAQDLTNRQAGSFTDARNAVVPVPPEPTRPDPWAVFNSPGEVVTYQQQVAEYNAANQHNVDVMSGYAGASSFNAKGMPQSFGSLTSDQAGIAVDSGQSTPVGGPDDGRRKGSDGGSDWVAPKSHAGPPVTTTGGEQPGPGGPAQPSGERPPQQTSPGGFTPTPSAPGVPLPVGSGGAPGSGSLTGGPGAGLPPGTGLVPVGGVGDGARSGGGRGGPGGASGGPGGGAGSGGRGPGAGIGGRAPEPHDSGGRPGAGPLPSERVGAGGRAGAPGAAGRSGGSMGGAPMAAGGRGRGEDDTERRSPDYLQEDDPEGLFGTDERTAPPVIGEDLEPPEPEPSSSIEAE